MRRPLTLCLALTLALGCAIAIAILRAVVAAALSSTPSSSAYYDNEDNHALAAPLLLRRHAASFGKRRQSVEPGAAQTVRGSPFKLRFPHFPEPEEPTLPRIVDGSGIKFTTYTSKPAFEFAYTSKQKPSAESSNSDARMIFARGRLQRGDDVIIAALEEDSFHCAAARDAGQPTAIIIDVGANVGAVSFAAAARGCRVVMVEPQPGNVALIQATINVNEWNDRVVVHAAAISERSGGTVRFRPRGVDGAINAGVPGYHDVDVAVLQISDLVPAHELPHLRVLRVGVGGHDAQAWKGAEGLVRRAPRLDHVLWELAPARFASMIIKRDLAALGFRLLQYPLLGWTSEVTCGLGAAAEEEEEEEERRGGEAGGAGKATQGCTAVEIVALLRAGARVDFSHANNAAEAGGDDDHATLLPRCVAPRSSADTRSAKYCDDAKAAATVGRTAAERALLRYEWRAHHVPRLWASRGVPLSAPTAPHKWPTAEGPAFDMARVAATLAEVTTISAAAAPGGGDGGGGKALACRYFCPP